MVKHYDKQFKLYAVQYYNEHKELILNFYLRPVVATALTDWVSLTAGSNKLPKIMAITKNKLEILRCKLVLLI
ncbi:hypothetical protein [Anaerocolumna aminovalerica]|uniref:hypothetical protein n=1 Tax=Anaerocolumna aminovalerica TaxID=1527 RepID=UPI000BE425BD|nr:hypothetical protein [Anaerocolumna aminovalerica]